MNSTLNFGQIAVFIVTGVAGACALLFYIRERELKKKISLLAFVLALVSALYVVFAFTTWNTIWITVEAVGLMLFLLFIWMAFRYSTWFVVLGWALHIVWDVGVHPQETAPYVPYWYAWTCVGFDSVIAVYIGWLLVRNESRNKNKAT